MYQCFRSTQWTPASFKCKLWFKSLSKLNVCTLCFTADIKITDILMFLQCNKAEILYRIEHRFQFEHFDFYEQCFANSLRFKNTTVLHFLSE